MLKALKAFSKKDWIDEMKWQNQPSKPDGWAVASV
jgi:hypothetical protein